MLVGVSHQRAAPRAEEVRWDEERLLVGQRSTHGPGTWQSGTGPDLSSVSLRHGRNGEHRALPGHIPWGRHKHQWAQRTGWPEGAAQLGGGYGVSRHFSGHPSVAHASQGRWGQLSRKPTLLPTLITNNPRCCIIFQHFKFTSRKKGLREKTLTWQGLSPGEMGPWNRNFI